MSRSITYTFSANNPTDVCKSQTLAGAGNLVLNGNLANQANSAVNFTDYGYVRSVLVDADATVSFTINGTQNGVNVSDVVTIAVANTPVESNEVFDTVTSISIDGAATARVGSGYKGFFKIIAVNLERDVINYSLSTHRLTAVSINTVIYGTLSNIVNNGMKFSDIIANNQSLFEIKALSSDNQYIFPLQDTGISQQPLYKFILIRIGGAQATANNSIQLNFTQT